MSFPFPRVTVVGLGLMGGSLARALKWLEKPPEIHGISMEPREVEEALGAGALDSGSGPGEPLPPRQTLVVLATPLRAALSLLASYREQLADSRAVLTDVVSLKAPLVSRARELGLESRYVGSHPMVGGTGTGFRHSRGDLYREASVWVVPGDAEEETVRAVEESWRALEARPRRVTAQEHDRRMAWVSHLPQLTANALASALKDRAIGPLDLGPGGRDMTRLAGSSPEMWVDLLAEASGDLLEGLSRVEKELAGIRERIQEGRLEEIRTLMTETRGWREDR